MRATREQVRRVGELAYRVQLPVERLMDLVGVTALFHLSDIKAGLVVKALLDVDVMPLPKTAKEAEARFVEAWERVLSSIDSVPAPASAKRKPKDGGPWTVRVAELLGLDGSTVEPCTRCAACHRCGGTQQVEEGVAVPAIMTALGFSPKSGATPVRTALRSPTFRVLKHIADTYGGGSLDRAADICTEVADLMDAAPRRRKSK